MGRTYDAIDDKLAAFLSAQPMFFVATAPSGVEGHVNVSPKGHDTFRVVDARTVAYLDLTGSGIETIAHLRENGRITFMFCAFDGPPRIVRLHGRGRVIEPVKAEFHAWRSRFPEHDGVRAIIVADISRISSSCGYGVPLMQFQGERPQMQEWLDRKGAAGLEAYKAEHNISIDGLPGLHVQNGPTEVA
jgi:hypothetical protein